MKKILRRIFVIALAATLFVMPTSTALAASTPVATYDADGLTMIDFQPDDLFVSGGGSNAYTFRDVTDATGNWYVTAGKTFSFQVVTKPLNTTTRIVIFKNGVLMSDYVSSSSTSGYRFDITPEGTNNYWTFVFLPYTDMTFSGYAGYIY